MCVCVCACMCACMYVHDVCGDGQLRFQNIKLQAANLKQMRMDIVSVAKHKATHIRTPSWMTPFVNRLKRAQSLNMFDFRPLSVIALMMLKRMHQPF